MGKFGKELKRIGRQAERVVSAAADQVTTAAARGLLDDEREAAKQAEENTSVKLNKANQLIAAAQAQYQTLFVPGNNALTPQDLQPILDGLVTQQGQLQQLLADIQAQRKIVIDAGDNHKENRPSIDAAKAAAATAQQLANTDASTALAKIEQLKQQFDAAMPEPKVAEPEVVAVPPAENLKTDAIVAAIKDSVELISDEAGLQDLIQIIIEMGNGLRRLNKNAPTNISTPAQTAEVLAVIKKVAPNAPFNETQIKAAINMVLVPAAFEPPAKQPAAMVYQYNQIQQSPAGDPLPAGHDLVNSEQPQQRKLSH